MTTSRGSTTARYYSAAGQIIESRNGGATTDLYYSAAWQVLEEQQSGLTTAQYVWSPGYVDQMVLRDTYVSGSFSQRVYALQDANYNVTALVAYDGGTSTWTVTQRYAYDAYGSFLTLDVNFASTTDAFNWEYTHQGLRYDGLIGWYDDRARIFSPTLQRFGQNDPLGYINGADTYRNETNNPVNRVDPSGLVSDEYCAKLAKTIANIYRELEERESELKNDPLGLPESAPGDDPKPSLSRNGHRRLIADLKTRLDEPIDEQNKRCPPPPCPPEPAWDVQLNRSEQKVLIKNTAAAGTTGVIIVILIIIFSPVGA